MIKIIFIQIGILVILITGCDNGDEVGTILPSTSNNTSCRIGENGWTIPLRNVADGGVGKDGIPSIDAPTFVGADEVDLPDMELVVAVKVGGEVRAYPHRILDSHEVVNDLIQNVPIAVTLCPLTGTALAFERMVNGTGTTLGVSGLLYNSNLILYDRASDSKWVQMISQAVEGELSCEKLRQVPTVELSWKGFRTLFPDSQVLSTETGFDRNYNNLPFSSTVSLNSTPVFPYEPKDGRLENYRRVHVLKDSSKAIAFDFAAFDSTPAIRYENSNLIYVHNEYRFIVSFQQTSDFRQFTAEINSSGVIMKDDFGNLYDLFGDVVNGANSNGLQLTDSYMGYWFAIGAMFPNLSISLDNED